MLKITILILLSALISLSLGLTPTLEKSIFFLRANNGLSNELYQTRKGILAYSVETVGDSERPPYIPQYLSLDLESGTATPILADLITYCGQGPSAFSRAYYHATTATFVYYCANNNSLLIIDEDDYRVQQIIAVNTATVFSEVKLTSDGYSVAILGMGPLYTENPIPSELIRVSLQSHTIVNHIVFNNGLAAGEAVYGYTSDDNNNMFVSTYTMLESVQGKSKNQAIYSMTLISNSYTLHPLTSFTVNSWTYYTDQLYCVGQLLFALLDNNLSILDQHGNVISTNTSASIVAHEYGAQDFYALVNTSQPYVPLQIARYSVKNAGYTLDYIGDASDIHLVSANMSSNSLLFTINPHATNFTVLDLQSQQPIYTTNTGYTLSNGLMLTNTTYSFFQNTISPSYETVLQIYDRNTHQLIKSTSLGVSIIEGAFYFDEESGILFYLYGLVITQIDLHTGVQTTHGDVNNCFGTQPAIIHATNKGGIPQFTTKAIETDCFVIVSEKIGQVQFLPPDSSGKTSTLVVDYDSVTLYHFAAYRYNTSQSTFNVTVYSYNQSSRSFEASAPTKIYEGLLPTSFFPSQKQVVAYTTGAVSVIEIPSLIETTYHFQPDWTLGSSFQDSLGNEYAILSEDQAWGQDNDAPGLLSGGEQSELYGTTDYTVQASATGLCSYWVVDGLVTSVGVVKFYNTCNQDEISTVLA